MNDRDIYLSQKLQNEICDFIEHLFRDSSQRQPILESIFPGWEGLDNKIVFPLNATSKSFSSQLVNSLPPDKLRTLLISLPGDHIGSKTQPKVIDFCQRIEKDHKFFTHNKNLKQKLIGLLQLLEKGNFDVRGLLNKCLPPNVIYEFDVDTFPKIESMVTELWDITDEDEFTHGSLWRLTHSIVNNSLSSKQIADKFRDWYANLKGVSDRILPEKAIDAPIDSATHILLIEVNGQFTVKGQYQVRAWIFRENHESRPKLVYSPKGG